MNHSPEQAFQVEQARVEIYASNSALGKAAAANAVAILRDAIRGQGGARMIVATGNSQLAVVQSLVLAEDVDWSRVEVFHMDEYAGLPEDHPASFRRWVRTRLAEQVHPRAAHYIMGDAPDPAGECRRYAALLMEAPIDLCLLGVGENGHIAFNDPHVADFHDPEVVKVVELDDRCRLQQVGEGHFASLADVPRRALTLTCPALMRARHLICSVPEKRKAEAVRNALEGPLSPACPASLLRTHPQATIYLDRDSASLLSHSSRSER
jgi:glucosamine-6-phosphate deaminase